MSPDASAGAATGVRYADDRLPRRGRENGVVSGCARCGALRDQECPHAGDVCCDCADLEVDAWFEGHFDGQMDMP
ncbi:MAG: hypothetical protein ACKOA9_07910 [Actinomycetota bacterium]